MRTFLGIDLPPAWRDVLAGCAQSVREGAPGWQDARWVPRDNLHVTLKFLGDLAEASIEPLIEELHVTLSALHPFEIVLAKPVTGVPSGRRARMLWTTFDDPTGECERLAAVVDEVATGFGAPAEQRPFRAHITLARTRTPKRFTPPPGLEECLVDEVHGGVHRSMSVGAVTLYSSTLSREGAVYDRLAEITLSER